MSSQDAQLFLRTYSQRTRQNLETYYQACSGPSALIEVMRYATLHGGKQVRPGLIYATALAYQLKANTVDAIACATELIHSYSLIHDDLPAMDNDDFRRGQPTTHKQFSEATAILAGDAMQSLAFEILASAPELNARQQVQMVRILAKAIGNAGMCGGQMMDIAWNGSKDIETIKKMHELKTGSLFSACIQMVLICIEPRPDADEQHLLDFARTLGLCFQIVDDLLDYKNDCGDTNETDAVSYPGTLGIEETKTQLIKHANHCFSLLEQIRGDTHHLEKLTHYIVHRVE